MKILYVITKSNFGGAQKYVYELALAARENGHEVMVACGGTGESNAPTGKLVSKITEQNIPVRIVKNFMRDMSLFRDIAAFFELLRLFRKEKPDVLHVTSSKAGALGSSAGRLAGIQNIIFTSHGLTMDETWRPKWQRILITISTWMTLKLSHKSIMINTETYLRARSLPGLSNKIILIKNGISNINFVEKSAARKKIAPNQTSSITYIGGIGELHPNKNWSAMIHTVAALPKDIHLFIIGEGEERVQLERLVKNLGLENRVHLLGYIENASKYLPAFDIFVLPSKKEGLPYVLLEAGLAAIPVVASDLPGNQDIIETGMTGLLVEPNPKTLTTSIQFLLRDEGVRRRLGVELQKQVVQEFSIARMTEETFSLYDSSKSRG